MGLRDRFLGGGDDAADDDDTDRWRVIVKDEKGRAAESPVESGTWLWEGDPPKEETFRYQYSDEIEEGREFVCVKQGEHGPDFEHVAWSFYEEPEFAETDDDIMRLERMIEEQVGAAAGDPEQPLEDRVLEAAMMGQIQIDKAKEIVSLKAELEQAKHGDQTDYFSEADLSDKNEVLTAGMMNLMSDYDSVGEAVEDVIGGAVGGSVGAVGPAATQSQPPAQPGQQAAQQGGQPATAPEDAQPPAHPEDAESAAESDDTTPASTNRQKHAAALEGDADAELVDEQPDGDAEPTDTHDSPTDAGDSHPTDELDPDQIPGDGDDAAPASAAPSPEDVIREEAGESEVQVQDDRDEPDGATAASDFSSEPPAEADGGDVDADGETDEPTDSAEVEA